MAQKDRFRSPLQPRKPQQLPKPRQGNATLLVSFPYVCPEHILVK